VATVSGLTTNRITAITAAIQAAFLLGYAITIAVLAVTRGAEGPEAVASSTGVVAEIITFALLGAGIVVVAIGRWRGASWSSVPFVVIQGLALAAALPVLFGSSATEPRLAALVACLSAVVGLLALIAGRSAPDTSSPPDAQPGVDR